MSDFEQAPISENRTAAKRNPNGTYRAREYLTPDEMVKLIEAARSNRYGHRDAALLLTIYRHALRAQEACDLEWSAVDFKRAELHVRRVKLGRPSVHPIRGDELRALRRLQREQDPGPGIEFRLYHRTRRPDDTGCSEQACEAPRRWLEPARLPDPRSHAEAFLRL